MDRLQRFSGAETVRADGGDRTVYELSEALADPRRRTVVSALAAADDSVPVSDIVDRIVESEDADASADRQRIRTSLVQVHFPMLSEARVAEYDDEDDAVVPLRALDDAQALLQPADGFGGSV